MKNPELTQVISAFLPDKQFTISAFGTGHIHDTFRICEVESPKKCYLLQRINQQVFKDIPGMMGNIALVTAHLTQKINTQAIETFTTPDIINTCTGNPFYKDASNNYWRLFSFIHNSVGYDKATSNKQAAEAGKAFGLFQSLLADLSTSQLVTTIPNFHNMVFRLENLCKAIANNKAKRVAEVANEIAFIEARKQAMIGLYQQIDTGEIPIRITHNDTKFNNVLLDKTTQAAKAVIDLDTVMPGSILYDFGDAVRTICNTGEEDEAEIEKIAFSLPLFEAFSQSYFSQTHSILTKSEKAGLVLSCRYMTFIMAVRFLTDFLEGDIYYKTKHARHNLQRVKAQLKLVACMEQVEGEMRKVVDKYL